MTKIIAVHGFMYDPEDIGGCNDPQEFFTSMRKMVDKPVEGFSYYSVPFGFKLTQPFKSSYQFCRAWLGSWIRGYLHPYRYAWNQAEKAGWELAKKLEKEQEPVDLICHSLGSRVVITALKYVPHKIRKVVILNGAELVRNATNLENKDILNIVVSTDDVLRLLGQRFSGDKNGKTVGQYGVPGWNNVVLDSPEDQNYYATKYGWVLKGDNPKSYWDHWYSYRFEGNHQLIQYFLQN